MLRRASGANRRFEFGVNAITTATVVLLSRRFASEVLNTTSVAGGDATASPPSPTSDSSPFADLKSNMSRSYKLDVVLQQTPHGIVLGKQENATTYSFVGFEGVPFRQVADRLLKVPADHRTFHTICGRSDTPCDFFGDIDVPLQVEEAEMERMLLESIQGITSKVETVVKKRGRGDHVPAPEVLVLQNAQATSKRSLHLHIKFPSACFSDYRAVKHIAERANGELGTPFFDLSCYRERGMMRLAYSRKAGHGALHYELLPMASAVHSRRLSALLAPTQTWSPADCLAKSFCVREEFLPKSSAEPSKRTTLPMRMDASAFYDGNDSAKKSAAKADKVTEYDKQGRPVPSFFSERAKVRRFREALKCVHALPTTAAEPYDQWIRVGLALHNFGSDERNFEEWVIFSVRAPQKFSREVCRSMWDKFPRHADHENWPRGYNYLTKTIWRELGIQRRRD